MSHATGRCRTAWTLGAVAAALSCTSAWAQVRIQSEAYVGRPFGVGRLEVELPEPMLPEPLGLPGLGVADAKNRILYPAVAQRKILDAVKDMLSRSKRPGLQILGQVLDRGPKTDVYFLFTGDEPLEALLGAHDTVRLQIAPREDPVGHRRLLAAWWREYSGPPVLLQKRSEYPNSLENYLRAMLGRRLSLSLPSVARETPWNERIATEVGLASGTESLRSAKVRQLFDADADADPADQPLPPAAETPPGPTPQLPKDIAVEPMALRVPQEFFYVRFGSFSNFLWVQDTLAQWGGDFQNLVASRGLDRSVDRRIETQLAVQNTVLARLLGDTIIADVAIVGTDLFLSEGGAFGLLFQAKSTMLLGRNLAEQRQQRLKNTPGAREERVKIGDREVSLLWTPDGTIRSYYVVDGDFHFVTTSKALAQRFLETRQGDGSLGALPEFRLARHRYPLSRKDVAFVYLSGPFFRNYVSPAYRIEMLRRVRSMAEIDMAQAALLASAAEGMPGDTLAQLVDGGFLPPHFGRRADGSAVALREDGVVDSRRGRIGAFVPIPDLETRLVNRQELDEYRRFVAFHQTSLHRLAPILAAVRREAIDAARNRITIDARMEPLAPAQHEAARRFVGAPETGRLAPIPADSVALEWIAPRQRFFGGLQFVGPAPELIEGSLLPFGRLRDLVVGYLGTTGDLDLLAWVDRRIGRDGDAQGYAQGEGGIWRRETDRFTLFSFHRDLIESVSRQLRYEDAKRPAQIRLRIVDLSATRLATFANAWGYSRTRDTSLGNLQLLHQIQQQLHVPPADARSTAELLLGATLVCPLGGEYRFRRPPQGNGWTSTALAAAPSGGPSASQPPAGYQAPPLNWFRGLELEAVVEPDAAAFHAELVMQNPPKPDAPASKQNAPQPKPANVPPSK